MSIGQMTTTAKTVALLLFVAGLGGHATAQSLEQSSPSESASGYIPFNPFEKHFPFLEWPKEDSEPSTIRATGTCSIMVDPDRARVTLSAVGGAEAALPAKEASEAATAAIFEALSTLAIDGIVVDVSLPFTTVESSAGYSVETLVDVTFPDVARMGEVAELMSTLDDVEIVAFSQFMTADRRRAAEGDCLAIATGNAEARARRIAEALGLTLGQVVAVYDERAPEFGEVMIDPEAVPARPSELRRIHIALSLTVEFAIR